MRSVIAAGLLVTMLALRAAASDEATTIDVQADGRGSIKLDVFEDARKSEKLLASANTPEAQARRAQELAVERLARWRGIVAWTAVQGSVTDDRRVRFRATGWFEDLAQVSEVLEPEGVALQSFVVTRASDALAVTLIDGAVDEVPGLHDDESLFDRGAIGVRMLRSVMRTILADSYASMRRERVLVMPAPITSHSGFSEASGRRATHKVDGRAALALLEKVLDQAEGLADEVEQGDLTVEAARAQLDAGVQRPRLVAESGLPAGAEAEAAAAAFTKAIDGARAGWQGSPWRERLERRRARPPATELPGDEEEPAPAPPPPPRRPRPEPAPVESKEPDRPVHRVTAGQHEPNEDAAHAATLQPGLWRGMELRGEDWYRLDVPAGHAAKVELLFDARATDLDLWLVGAAGETLAVAEGLAGRERLRVVPLVAGPCFVRVLAAGGWPGEKAPSYRLDVDVQAVGETDAFEPNEPPHPPARLAPGKHEGLVSDGEDRYALTAGAGARVEVTLTFPEEQGELDLELHDAQGRVLGAARGAAGKASASCLGPAGGVVTLRVHGDEGVRYVLGAQVTKGPAPDALEPNDAPAAARALAAGSYPDLLLEADDWYRVTVPAGQTLRVTASFAHADGDLDLSLHRPDGALLRASTGQADEERLEYTPATAGPLLVRAHGTGGAPRYRLAVALAPFTPADKLEPNDSREAARDVAPGEHANLRCTVEDWYRVALKKGQRLRVAIAFDPAHGDLDLELFAPDGEAVAASTTLAEREEATWTAEADGKHFVRVYRNEAPYTLTIRVE